MQKKQRRAYENTPFFIVSIILIFCLLLWLLCLYRNPLFSCFSRSNLIVSTFYFSLNPLHTSFVQIEICFYDIFTWLSQVTRFMRYTQITHSTKTKVFLQGFVQKMWPNLNVKSLIENFIYCAVITGKLFFLVLLYPRFHILK